MNLRTALKITEVLALASVRIKSNGTVKETKKSVWQFTNITMGILFTLISAIITFFGIKNLNITSQLLEALANQILFFIPSAITFSCIIFSLLYEFNQSAFNISLDSINWLPITAGDYVLGSSLCTIYFSLPMLALVFGASLTLAFMTQAYAAWALSIILGLIGGLLGGFATEILRALSNRATTTIFKKGGKASIIGRFIFYMTFFLVFMLAFNVTSIVQVAAWFNEVAGGAWFFPLFWSSLAVDSLLRRDYALTAMYFVLTLLMTTLFYFAGSKARERSWVPEPIAVNISSKDSVKPLTSQGGFLGISAAEIKIIQKDLRGLIRRHEMMVYLALPFIMIIITIISEGFGELFNPYALPAEKLSFFLSIGFGLLYLTFFLSITSVGQEGGAAINLISAPIQAYKIARAKFISTLLLPITLFTFMVILIVLVVKPDAGLLALIIAYGTSLITETSKVGLIFGSRFVDYNVVPRARFTRPEGMILGILAIMGVIVVNLGAILLVEKLGVGVLTIPIQALVIAFLGIILNFVLWKILRTQIEYALKEAPT